MKKISFLIIAFHLFHQFSFSQSKIVLPSAKYDEMKATGQFAKGVEYIPVGDNTSLTEAHVTKEHLQQMNYKSLASSGCSCLVPIDTTFSVAEFIGSAPPDYRNDDLSTGAKSIPFNYCLYGTNYTSFYINTNGNISFGSPYGTYTSTGFPSNNFVMLAPFWADVDIRNLGSGLVYYKITPTYAIVQWRQVGYYSYYVDKLNTFQIIITDGTDPILPAGFNTAFCYGDMQWTTASASGGIGGFGGTPTTAGVNKGDGINYIQIGRFDHAGSSYDGPYGNNDGVSFLDNQSFYFNTCSVSNLAPFASGFNNCDTVKICGTSDTLCFSEYFFSGEAGQITTVSVNLNGVPNAVITANTAGNISTTSICFYASALNAGNNIITFTATDNGNPAQTTVINVNIYVDTLATTMNPVISGNLNFCPGDSSLLSVTPTTYDSYLWSTGSSNTSIMVHTSGNYFVTSSLNGCYLTKEVTVQEYPNPTPTIAGYPHTCSGSPTTVLYSDSLIYNSYLWSGGSTNDSVTVGNGFDTLTVTDLFGCSASTYISVTTTTGSVSTTLIDSTLSSLTSGTAYQWIDCNNSNSPITGAINQSYTVTANGSYAVIVTNGACSDTSACVVINNIGIIEYGLINNIIISPNPFTSQTTITFSQEQKNTTIKITDVLGNTIQQSTINNRQSIIDMSGVAKGIYFVRIEDEKKNVINKKIIVQ